MSDRSLWPPLHSRRQKDAFHGERLLLVLLLQTKAEEVLQKGTLEVLLWFGVFVTRQRLR